MASNAGSKSLFSCALIISWKRLAVCTIPCSVVLLFSRSCCCMTSVILWIDFKISLFVTCPGFTSVRCTWLCCCWWKWELGFGNKGGGKIVLTFGRSNIAELLTLPTPVGCTVIGSLDTGYVCNSWRKFSYPVSGMCRVVNWSAACTLDFPTFNAPSDCWECSMNSLWMPLFALLFFCEASVFRETDVIFSEFWESSRKSLWTAAFPCHCSLSASAVCCIICEFWECSLNSRSISCGWAFLSEIFVDTSHSSNLISLLLVTGMNASPA